jgi:hypothetical protein
VGGGAAVADVAVVVVFVVVVVLVRGGVARHIINVGSYITNKHPPNQHWVGILVTCVEATVGTGR